MSALPYFRWYPADALGDQKYSALSDMELGFYHRCLNVAWLNGGLPADLDELASTLHVTRKYLDKIWAKVGRCFQLNDCVHPKYVNPRQEKERSYAIDKSIKAATSVAHRRDRAGNGRSTDVGTNDVLPARARAESESESSGVDLSLILAAKSYTMDEPFMMFMAEVALTGAPLIDADYIDAHREWASLDMPLRLLAVGNFREKREAGIFNDPAMVMRPWKWIKRREFNRLIAQKAAKNGDVPYAYKPPPNLMTAERIEAEKAEKRRRVEADAATA